MKDQAMFPDTETEINKNSRRDFLKTGLTVATLSGLGATVVLEGCTNPGGKSINTPSGQPSGKADYTIHIKTGLIEVAPQYIISTTTYNGQFPGPLLRFKEGERVTVDIYNDTDTPEQFHWHGQFLPVDVDGAAEEGTPYIPAHGMRRQTFIPGPSGFRFYHTHLIAGANLTMGQT